MTRPSLERTYLHGAAEAGKVEEVACILRKSKDSVNAPDANGWTPLICAANFGHLAVCKLLLNAGADPRLSIPCFSYVVLNEWFQNLHTFWNNCTPLCLSPSNNCEREPYP